MNSLLERALSGKMPPRLPSAVSEPGIEEYLDYLCAPLLGIVPYAERLRLRLETTDHLLALKEEFEADGFAPSEALAAALREHGAPWRIGQSFADAWLGGETPEYQRAAPTLRAFGWFGALTVANLLAVEWSVYQPLQWQSWLSPLVQCGVVVSPLIAGAMTGAGMDSRTRAAICGVAAMLSVVSLAVGLLLLPMQDGLHFALAQFILWPPLGCLSAAITGGLRRRFLLRGYPSARVVA